MTTSEIQHRAAFEAIRYAQCWEDSRLLNAALKPRGRHLVSIGSAGDNSFALLAGGASTMTVVEMNPAQICCIELRRAAYLKLDHQEFLELIGSRESDRREKLYRACREILPATCRDFWDGKTGEISQGIGSAGKFERYFRTFREKILPLAHNRRRVLSLLEKRTPSERESFYENDWNNLRWRMIFRLFFSRKVMGALGRDPEFFRYVEGSVGDRILERTRHALVNLDPSENPYLHWILTGSHGEALPEALEEKNFVAIRNALEDGRLDVISSPLEELLETRRERAFDGYNLSDIFEYMSPASTGGLLGKIVAASRPGARLAYWNMLAPRCTPPEMSNVLRRYDDESEKLFATDRAFFYSRFVVEEVTA